MNTAIALPILIVLGIATALGFVWGAPIFGIPLLVIALIFGAFWMFGMRARQEGNIHNELDQVKTDESDFSARDRETLTH